MGVQAVESTDAVWAKWQGSVINGAFPLGRLVGCSGHSGVYLTRSAALGSSDLAIKLVPADRALTEVLLRRWKRAGGINHPHLIRLLQWGGCRLGGMPFLYLVMEYAEQTLAEVLQHRTLDDDEAHKVLQPTLDALAFLHAQKLVHGQLKPTNVLVVGDELKLASDTIRRAGDAEISRNSPPVAEPQEARGGSNSTAGDIWALGACLYEALGAGPPIGSVRSGEAIVLPADFPEKFRDIVARCLSPSPENRPGVPELMAWADGKSEGPGSSPTPPPSAVEASPPSTLVPAPPTPVEAPPEPRPAPASALSAHRRAAVAAALGAIVIVALVWTQMRAFQSHRAPVPAPAPEHTASPGATASRALDARAPAATVAAPKPAGRSLPPSSTPPHQVMPEVSPGALRTVRGHIKVWVRVIVDPDGSVFAATADRAGPSRYFERLAIEAAKQWTFAPADGDSQRLMQIRFEFSRAGTTAHAVPLR